MFLSGKIALLLISLGIGYMVCISAVKEKDFLRSLGVVIGTIMIISSILISVYVLLAYELYRAPSVIKRPPMMMEQQRIAYPMSRPQHMKQMKR